jgi:hypothetical protein
MRSQIKAGESRIRFENHGNHNTNTVPSLVLKMKRGRADERLIWNRCKACVFHCAVLLISMFVLLPWRSWAILGANS